MPQKFQWPSLGYINFEICKTSIFINQEREISTKPNSESENRFCSCVTFLSQTGTYIGDWKNGLQHGKGSAVYLNGNQYGGEFKHGLKNGYGEFIVINGDR